MGAVVAFILTALVVGTALPLVLGSNSTQTNGGSTVDCGYEVTCSAQNPSGLQLTIAISSTSLEPNGSLSFNVSMNNPTSNQITLANASEWYLGTLSWPCNGGAIPYGMAAFRGHYTLGNVLSAGNALRFALSSCHFNSTPARFSIKPTSAFEPPYVLNDSRIYAIDGGYLNKGGSVEQSVNTLGSSRPGPYTLAVGDEWGDLVLVHFSVIESSP
jgi:hypothetical protein